MNTSAQFPAHKKLTKHFSWKHSWECYVILLIAGFLRLYQINASEFDADQAAIFGMARAAVRYGMVPLVSIRASIGIEHPPVAIYLYMLPAFLSANPLWAIVLVGLLNTFAVLLTYLFTRRYYGRLAACIAALLYAAATEPLTYSRFIWQPNMIAPLTLLFLFALFWGVVERHKGWLFPAILLLGLIYQLHETSTLLIFPLLVAIVLAPGTVRWRDLAYSLLGLLMLFSPYLLWEYSTHFADVNTVLNMAKHPAHIDDIALTLYQAFISPYTYSATMQIGNNPATILRLFVPIFYLLRHLLLLLVFGGFAIAALQAMLPTRITCPPDRVPVRDIPTMDERRGHAAPIAQVHEWWIALRNSPYRCGLLILCVWQILPLLILSRHSVTLYPYYLLMLLPGPFMLAGLCIVRIVQWTHLSVRLPAFLPLIQHTVWLSMLRYAMYVIAIFVVLAQLATCTASLLDSVQGHNGHGKTWNDLGSLQHALSEADSLAQTHHLNRVYVGSDSYTQTAFGYLAGQMQTPTTIFDDSHCLPLPAPNEGPAVLLVSPFAQLTQSLLNAFATPTVVDQPSRLGSLPFKLYIVAPPTEFPSTSSTTFGNDLQLLSAQTLSAPSAILPSSIVLRWSMQRTVQPALRTSYNFLGMVQLNAGGASTLQAQCSFSALRANDQLLMAFPLSNKNVSPTSLTVGVQSNTTIPYNPMFGPLHAETDIEITTPQLPLHTTSGASTITMAPIP